MGLRASAGQMTKEKETWVSNEKLRALSHKKGVCNLIYNETAESELSSHNVCSDSMESLVI
jgi:dsRNA-specific ribonuclease